MVESFVDGDTPKTKAALATLRAVTERTRVLVVLGRDDELNWLSLRNVPRCTCSPPTSSTRTTCWSPTTWSSPRTALDEFLGAPGRGRERRSDEQ